MATYSRRVRQTTRIEYVVPAAPSFGAHVDEIDKAITAAQNESGPGIDVWVQPGDDEVIVSFERSEVTQR